MKDNRGKNFRTINAKRAVTVRTLKSTEKSITDGERLKREMESKKAAMLWAHGYEKEPRK